MGPCLTTIYHLISVSLREWKYHRGWGLFISEEWGVRIEHSAAVVCIMLTFEILKKKS